MAEITAKLSYLRMAPRKVRQVAKLLRRKSAKEAEDILKFSSRRASGPLLKLLRSALANAKNNFQMQKDNLYIKKLEVNEGPKLKRIMPRSQGRAYMIQKKTSHIKIVLEEIIN